jgi:hypothetical protein
MSGHSQDHFAAPETFQSETVLQDSASSTARTGAASGRGMQILNLCRESSPSADALAQLLSDPIASAGINEQDNHSRTPLIEGKRTSKLILLHSQLRKKRHSLVRQPRRGVTCTCYPFSFPLVHISTMLPLCQQPKHTPTKHTLRCIWPSQRVIWTQSNCWCKQVARPPQPLVSVHLRFIHL